MAPGILRRAAIPGLLISLLALAACQTTATAPGNTVAVEPAAGKTAVEPAAADTPEAPPVVAALPPQPVEPQVDDNPNQLMGLDRGGLTALLGAPDLVRREKPAEIWQYVTADCVFDVVLYDNGAQYRVTYLEARDAAADRLSPRPCLYQILRARQAAPVS